MSAGNTLPFTTKRVAMAAAVAALSLVPLASSWALGLGRLNVQSALGEPLRADIDVTSITQEEAASLQARMASQDTYRAAGVDYNPVLGGTSISLQRRADGRPYLRLSSDRPVTEPFVDAILDLSWSSGRLVREYTLLFDPPAPNKAPSSIVSPAMDAPATPPAPAPAVPAPASSVAPAPSSVAPPRSVTRPLPKPVAPAASAASAAAPSPAASRPAPPPKPAPAPKPVPAPKPAPAPVPAPATTEPAVSHATQPGGQTVKVRPGDSLSQIAERTLPQGVALDQMVVGLYRANPEAFLGNNMNRLKSGVVLNVPDADKAKAETPEQAHQVIVAQSADFDAYRHRVAAGVVTNVSPTAQRQASGKVEAEVQDRKQMAAPTPDKLTLSKGAMSNAKPGVEDKLAKERAQKDSGTRVAELSRNLDELRKLKGQAASAPAVKEVPPKPAAAPASLAASVAKPVPPKPVASAPAPAAPVVASKPVVAPAKVASAPAPAPVPAPVVASKPEPVKASAPEVKPSAPVVASAPVVPPEASEPARAASGAATNVANAASEPAVTPPSMVPTIPKPVQIPVPDVQAEPPSLFESINPLALAGAGAGLAALAGLGLYMRSRRRPDGAETSFLESRLQPDSFFGASGGQRVDTRDATGGPSSMSYSLSQLDAIGDVDPVAEADVYLAYGRDLQAEEILKEALRSNPDRLAIRSKLLEVYAKRRDTKGFEQLAVDLHGLTQGQGEEWQKAQEMGLSIDPENPLYQPGGQPAVAASAEPLYPDHLGASTVPMSEMPDMAAPPPPMAPAPVADDLGLDFDISAPAPLADVPEVPRAVTAADLPTLEPVEPAAPIEEPAGVDLDFDLPIDEVAPTAPAPLDDAVVVAAPPAAPTVDLASISLDLDEPAQPEAAAPAAAPEPEVDEAALLAADPMARKLDLAEEFRQIGDVDGARELLQEVLATSQGPVKAKAQAMLDSLG